MFEQLEIYTRPSRYHKSAVVAAATVFVVAAPVVVVVVFVIVVFVVVEVSPDSPVDESLFAGIPRERWQAKAHPSLAFWGCCLFVVYCCCLFIVAVCCLLFVVVVALL